MRFRLRTLLLVVALLLPVLAGVVALFQLQWYRSQGVPVGTDRAVSELEADLKSRPAWDGKEPHDQY